MRFSIAPPQGQASAFDQWKDAMRAVCRLPMGIPTEFRKKVWLSLADHYLVQLRINWDKTLRFVFNERSNPDDDKLGMQIVKDLHRTGCSNFSGDDNVEDRAILKRVLLAYARWNKRVGYCQGFNVIAALLLNVMDRKEDDALKVMIYLIDSVLPESYFANNLRALSVDMAVFRDLLALTYPRLSKHLDRLQLQAQDVKTGACYEPPLTNVFTMQWFLTLFATCLPVSVVLRVWDSVLLEGSEILLRTALTIWENCQSKRILGVSSADEFYSVMGELSTSIMEGSVMDGDSIIKSIYSLGDFPFPHLNELREKYTYNIRPLTPSTSSGVRKVGGRSLIKAMLYSDDDDMDDDDVTAMACMPGEMSSSSSDISVLGPGVYGSGLDPCGGGRAGGGDMQMERMSTDINSLKLQYQRLKHRQQQAHIIIAAASQKKAQLVSSSSASSSRKPLSSSSYSSSSASPHKTRGGGGGGVFGVGSPSIPASILLPSIESPTAMNHLFVGKHNKPPSASARNRVVTQGPRISQHSPYQQHKSAILSKQLQAVANAQAVSKSQRMKSSMTRSNNNNDNSKHQGDEAVRQDSSGSKTAGSNPEDKNIGPTASRSPSKDTDNNSDVTSTTPKSLSNVASAPTSSSSNEGSHHTSAIVVKTATDDETTNKILHSATTPRDSSDNGCDRRECDDGVQNAVCETQQVKNKSSSRDMLTPELVVHECNETDVVKESIAVSQAFNSGFSNSTQLSTVDLIGPGTLKNPDSDDDAISDKGVQTSFEVSDHFDNVTTDVVVEHESQSSQWEEDSLLNISRGSPTTTTTSSTILLCDQSGTETPKTTIPVSDTTSLNDSRVTKTTPTPTSTETTTTPLTAVPYYVVEEDQKSVNVGPSSSSQQQQCATSIETHRHGSHDADDSVLPQQQDISPSNPLLSNSVIDLPSPCSQRDPHRSDNRYNTSAMNPPPPPSSSSSSSSSSSTNPLAQTITTLHPGESLPEDSGIDSSSTASPSSTPKRGPKSALTLRSDSVDDGIEIPIHSSQDIDRQYDDISGKKDDLLLVATTTTTTTSSSNPFEITQIGECNNEGVCKPSSSHCETELCIDNALGKIDNKTPDKVGCEIRKDDGLRESEVHSSKKHNTTTELLASSKEDAYASVGGSPFKTQLELAARDNQESMLSDGRDLPASQIVVVESPSQSPSSPTTPSLSSITTTTSPQRKFFRRSVSCTVSSPGLIETVPVPENLTGSVGHTTTTRTHQPKTQHAAKEHTTTLHKRQQQQASQASPPSSHESSSLKDSQRKIRSQSSPTSTEKDIKSRTSSVTVTPGSNSKQSSTSSVKSRDVPSAYSRRLSTPASCHMTSGDLSAAGKKPFNPFPVKLFNANRAKTGLKLGLYSATTLEQLKGLKPRTTST